MPHKKYIIMLIAMLSLLAIFATSMTFVFSQESGVPTVVVPTDIPATATALAEQALADTREIKSRDWSNFRVAYLVDTSLELDEIVSAATIQEKTGALVFDNAEKFTQAAAEQPFQIVLIHGSMKDKVDSEWIKQAYRYATAVIIGIDMYRQDLVAILGNNCIKPKDDLLNYFPHTWAAYMFAIYGGAEEYKEGIYDAELKTCTKPQFDPGQSTHFSVTRYAGMLRTEPELEALDWYEFTFSTMVLTYQFDIEKLDNMLSVTETKTP
jgi:hypothetical protein